MHAEIDFGILGSTLVRLHGHPVAKKITRRRHRQTLAVLLAHPRQRLSFETLEAWIWTDDEQPPQDRAGTFHTYGKLLRRALKACESEPKLTTVNGGFRLDVDRDKIDYCVFGDRVAKARSARADGDHEQAARLAQEAIELWRGEPLADLQTELAELWRRRVVQNEWIPANLVLLDEQISLHRFHAALLRLDELERDHWPDVNLVKRRLQVLKAVSRHGEATDRYLTAHRRLRDDADDEAADELRKFFDDLKQSRVTATPWRAEKNVVTVPPPRQLPHDVRHFTGRTDLLGELDELTGVAEGKPRPSVVVLSGLAGIGKTTVAVRWARTAARYFPSGILFVDLRGYSRTPPMEPSEVVDAFLTKLGFPIAHILGPAARAEKLLALLSDRPMLIILDNAKDSAQVRDLLPVFEECVVVITSRHRLTELSVRHGIQSLPVAPLDAEQSAELLAGRMDRRAREEPGFVRDLAEQCRGLPLALSLVAHRAESHSGASLSSLVRQLGDLEILLTIGTEGDGHEHSLNSVFHLSYEALSLQAARVFRLLGLHPGTEFSVEAASALAGEGVFQTRRRLDELVGAHLVDQFGEVDRYRMHDLVLGFAARRAERDSETDQARQRMLNFYLHSALRAHQAAFPQGATPPMLPIIPGCSPMNFTSEQEALNWFLMERVNLNSITHYATDHHDNYTWRIPHLTARAFERLGFYEDIVSGFSRAASAAARDAAKNLEGAKEAEATSLNDLGHFLINLGETTKAQEFLQRALRIVDELGIPVGRLTVKINLSLLRRKSGDLPAAAEMYQECLRMALEIGDSERQATVEHHLGLVFRDRQSYDIATAHFERALEIRKNLPGTSHIATLTELCATALAQGRSSTAEKLGEQALGLLNEHAPDVALTVRLCTVLSELALDRRNFRQAAGYAQKAVELAEAASSADAEAAALDLLAQARLNLGERESARGSWLRSMAIFHGRGHDRRAAAIARKLAGLGTAVPVPVARQGSDRLYAQTPTREHHPNEW